MESSSKKPTILDSVQFCENFYIFVKSPVHFWYYFYATE
ncbi:hypothetical protein LEP1GSC191_1473 [Leptospira borgpetersenii serovar Mini str. 201000851]|uniref:Uncharacterized protein n=1 Tax=Leptospira borgpetersenii str. 200701203 TaxID=1193007 RepID=M3GHW6_LEPBO|nr:hypothetical protein LEP1GSC123_2810 [Leptospira borgpetersenii str. 200701203]ENO64076.1 hypothetical protein LEP1GSC191_1473 [Leptospira borgpetersenii serovar Mini str. 201000851]